MCWCVWKIYEENRGSKIPSLTIITTPKPVTSKLNHFLFACESFLCVCSGGVGKKEQSSESLAYFLSSCLEAPTQHRFEEREGRKRAKVQFSSVSLFFSSSKGSVFWAIITVQHFLTFFLSNRMFTSVHHLQQEHALKATTSCIPLPYRLKKEDLFASRRRKEKKKKQTKKGK